MPRTTPNPFKAISDAERRENSRLRDEEIGALPPKIRRRVEAVPIPARALHLRAVTGKASPRQAIRAFCQECIGHDREAIATCTALACRLWHHRPFQPKKGSTDAQC
jgi:hypothetical protein